MNRAATAGHHVFYYSKLKDAGIEGGFSEEAWKMFPSSKLDDCFVPLYA